MPAWTEDSLRKAASWQAFKEGSGLLAGGAVVDAQADPGGWQATVRVGKRMFRVRVTVKSPTDWEVRCACPENQRSGGVCAHAVAGGLAALRNPPKDQAAAEVIDDGPSASIANSANAAATAWEVRLPAGWARALANGRFSALVRPMAGVAPCDADQALNDWIASSRLSADRPHALSLAGDQAESFLNSLVDHPRVEVEPSGEPIVIRSGMRLRLEECAHDGGRVTMVPHSGDQGWFSLGGGWWRASGRELWQASGNGDAPEGLSRLMRGESLTLEVMPFLRYLDRWRPWLEFPDDPWFDRIPVVPAPCVIRASVSGDVRQLRLTVRVRHMDGSEAVPGEGVVEGLPRVEGGRLLVRDECKEASAVQTLRDAGFVAAGDGLPGVWKLSGEPLVAAFLGDVRPWLRHEWEWEETVTVARAAEASVVVVPHVEVRGTGDDWLSFAIDYRTDSGEILDPGEARRLVQGAMVRDRSGRRCRIAPGLASDVDDLLGELDGRREGDSIVVDRRAALVVEELRRRLAADASSLPPVAPELPATFRGTLRPYQAQGVAWLADRAGRLGGAILADDMGLGKTVQTIAWVEQVFATEPAARVLVVATASLLGNWQAEWNRFAPARPVRILHGANRESLRAHLGDGEVWITTHATLVRDLAWFLRQEFAVLVVDEASLLRNHRTDQARAVAKVNARSKLALTGTPVENRISDLWAIFSWVQPGWLGSHVAFRERYEVPAQSDGSGRLAALERLRCRTSPFILRRTKDAVAPELPSKLVIDEFCELEPYQQSLYAELAREGRRVAEAALADRASGRARMTVLTTLLRLRQICCDPTLLGSNIIEEKIKTKVPIKHAKLIGILEEAFEGNHKVIVFSQFQKQLLELEKRIKGMGYSSLRLDGGTRDRTALVNKFQSADGPPVFLISLKAGGYGLNLTAADVVVHMDPWWNPAVEDQATDRAHRIGQTRPVTVYRLLVRNSVEEAVMRLQRDKRALAGAVDESGSGDPAGWSIDDLCGLLEG